MPPYEPDANALRRSSVSVVPAIGALGEGGMARRGGEALARLLGVEPLIFPGAHGGFVANETSPGNDPDAFAAKRREAPPSSARGIVCPGRRTRRRDGDRCRRGVRHEQPMVASALLLCHDDATNGCT